MEMTMQIPFVPTDPETQKLARELILFALAVGNGAVAFFASRRGAKKGATEGTADVRHEVKQNGGDNLHGKIDALLTLNQSAAEEMGKAKGVIERIEGAIDRVEGTCSSLVDRVDKIESFVGIRKVDQIKAVTPPSIRPNPNHDRRRR
jgi:hypothetical protein